MREFRNWDTYLNILLADIYSQPEDKGHFQMMKEVLENWLPQMPSVKSILDIGCGETCAAARIIEEINPDISYTGITLGKEVKKAKQSGFNVLSMDMNFLELEDNSFDLIFARHCAEHSPSPLLSLFEWNRVCRDFLCLIVPRPTFYARAGGQNHYYVLYDDQWLALADRAGFRMIWRDDSNETEWRWMMEKKK